MLTRLRVENFAVVDKIEIEFSEGLNILTGETGTGKSILIDAIKLFLDKKLAGNILREKKRKLVVEALFVEGEQEFVLKREISDGNRKRSVSHINGEIVPFQQMKEKAEKLLNIYGQHEYLFLMSASNHMNYLDAFTENEAVLNETASICAEIKSLQKELKTLEDKKQTAAERADFLTFRIDELNELGLDEIDEEKLEKRQKLLSSSEDVRVNSEAILAPLYNNEESIYTKLAEIVKSANFLSSIDNEITPYKNEIENFINMIPEFSSKLTSLSEGSEFDENELNDVEEKLFKLKRLKEKYTTDFNGLLEKLEEMRQEKENLMNADSAINDIKKKIDHLLDEYRSCNLTLRNRREKGGNRLSAEILRELAKLEMKQAEFIIKIDKREPELENITERGSDSVEFLFSPNPGISPEKIGLAASGGELSRLMLALKSLQKSEEERTFIFDEVDSGIGGKTADFVGKKLKEIAERNQVLCISHLPQIAAFADKHFLVGKKIESGKTFSFINRLSRDERVFEVARLMAGGSVNRDVEEAARQLIESRTQ